MMINGARQNMTLAVAPVRSNNEHLFVVSLYDGEPDPDKMLQNALVALVSLVEPHEPPAERIIVDIAASQAPIARTNQPAVQVRMHRL